MAEMVETLHVGRHSSGVDVGLSVLIAGAIGLVAWEGFARLVAPMWLGFALDPTGLIEAAIGLSGLPALLLHVVTGLVAFPAAYRLVALPIAGLLLPGLPWAVLAMGYGVALWVFAMYGMASVLGGMPAFLGFAPVAWASLVGHLALAFGIGATFAFGRGGRA